MADGYWRYGDGRPQAVVHAAPAPLKRPRPDYPEIAGGVEYVGYLPREEERIGQRVVRDTESIEASYDRYLRSGANIVGEEYFQQVSSYGAGESGRPLNGGIAAHHVEDPRLMSVGRVDSRNIAYSGGRTEIPLPPDASSTLFVEGLPVNCTRREVSHIFRPFVGFREVRLVSKESRHPGGEPHVLCFADFTTPNQAAIALEALQGYKFDEHDRESPSLRLQFARFPGPRSTGGPRGRH